MRQSLPPLRYLKDNVQLRRGALGQRLVHTLIVGGEDRGTSDVKSVRPFVGRSIRLLLLLLLLLLLSLLLLGNLLKGKERRFWMI